MFCKLHKKGSEQPKYRGCKIAWAHPACHACHASTTDMACAKIETLFMKEVHKSCKRHYQASLWRCVNSRLEFLDACQTWKGPTHVLATEVEHLLCLLDASNETAGNGQPAKECHTVSTSVAAHSSFKNNQRVPRSDLKWGTDAW